MALIKEDPVFALTGISPLLAGPTVPSVMQYLKRTLQDNNPVIGESNPDYKSEIAKRVDAGTYYYRRKFVVGQPDHYYYAVCGRNDPTYKYYAQASAFRGINGLQKFTSFPSDLAWVDDLALKRLKSKIAGSNSTFKALVPLGELKETRALYRTTVETTNKMLKTLLEVKRRPKRVFAAASKAWLQFSFAISPTIADLASATESISAYLTREDFGGTYKGSATERTTRSRTNSDLQSFCSMYGLRSDAAGPIRETYTCRYVAGVKFNMRTANNYGLLDFNRSFGLGLGDLIPTAWELVPFSWVVDYFTTTGDVLSDTFEADASNTYYISKSRKYVYEYDDHIQVIKYASPLWPIATDFSDGNLSNSGYIYERQPVANLPTRSLRIKSLDEIGANGVKRVLNLAALLVK